MINAEAMPTEAEVVALRRSLRDLAALAALPAIWISSDLKSGLQNLAEVLSAGVRAEFIFIRVQLAPDESVDAGAQRSLRPQAGVVDALRGHLAQHLDFKAGQFPSVIPSLTGPGQLRIDYSPVAMEGRVVGWVIAGANAELDIQEHERLLLHAGAAQVAILLQRHGIESARAEKARKLQEQARLLEGLNQVGTALVAELNLEKIVQRVTDVGREITGAAFGAFFYNVNNEQGESYMLYTLSGAPREAFSKYPMPRNSAIFNPTFQGESIVRIADVRKDPRFGKNAPYHGMPAGHLPVVSYLAVPVKSRGGEVLGGLFYGHPAPNVFTAGAEAALVGLASQAAIAIDNANLYAALQKELARAKQADEAVRRLALIVQSSDDAIIAKDLNGIITSWNPGAERIFGYTAEETVGHSIYLLIPPERRHEEAAILGKLRKGERIDHYETVRRAKDGRLVDVSLTISPLKLASGEIVGASKIARDVTEKRRTESQQNALHELADAVNRAVALPEIYAAALRAIGRFHGADRSAVLLHDADGKVRFGAWDRLSEEYRKAAEEYSPWQGHELDPKPVCIDDVAEATIEPRLRSAMLREGINAVALIPLTYEKRLLGRVAVYFDAPHRFSPTELRPIETVASQVAFAIKRTKSAEELEALIAERTASLRVAIEQMEEFSYSVSHDLRSPVRAMRGYAEVLLADYGGRLDNEGRELLGRIERNGQRMDNLIQDLLTFSRLARREMKIEPVSLDRLVREIVPHYPEMSPDVSTIEIVGVLPVVMAHEPSLMQVVSNLLSNAVKFVAPGTRPHVRVSSETIGNRARLWFRDNGIGIAPEDQHRVFGLFERVHADRKYEGTGIGLAIVRKAVERMNGAVGVVSDGVTGSRFWIELDVPEHS